jgi:hypothetical protein
MKLTKQPSNEAIIAAANRIKFTAIARKEALAWLNANRLERHPNAKPLRCVPRPWWDMFGEAWIAAATKNDFSVVKGPFLNFIMGTR